MAIGFRSRDEEIGKEYEGSARITPLSDMRIAGLAACMAPSVNRCSAPHILREMQASEVVGAAVAAYTKHFKKLDKEESRALLESVDHRLVDIGSNGNQKDAIYLATEGLARADGERRAAYWNAPLSAYAFEILFNMVSYMKSMPLRLVNGIVIDERDRDRITLEQMQHGNGSGEDIIAMIDHAEIAALSSPLKYASSQLGLKSAAAALSLGARLYNEGVCRWRGSFADFLANALEYGNLKRKNVGEAYDLKIYKLVNDYGKKAEPDIGALDLRRREARDIMDSVIDVADRYGKSNEHSLKLAAAIGSYRSGDNIELVRKKNWDGFRVNSRENTAAARFAARLEGAMKRLGNDYARAEDVALGGLGLVLANDRYSDEKALLQLLEKLRMKVGYSWFTRISHDIEIRDEDAERIAEILNSAGKLKLDAFSLMVDGAAAAYNVKVKVELVSKGMIVLSRS